MVAAILRMTRRLEFRRRIRRVLPLADMLLAPLVLLAAYILKQVRRAGLEYMPYSKGALLRVGAFPICDHYYEPRFDYSEIRPISRSLPGIDWNVPGQLELLSRFRFSDELTDIPQVKTGRLEFHFDNEAFESGDAEYWYQLIRTVKPRRIIEIGSGYSTLMARRALERNAADDSAYRCRHVCIEPYEMPWLEQIEVEVIRRKVEDVGLETFTLLGENDVLFIDSSHIIRPDGDVLFEYLELLPTLRRGVIVHIHDIFSPRDYPEYWLRERVLFWNEQYLLEAFLSHNVAWTVLGALNFLHNAHYDRLKAIAPSLTTERDPGSFYIQRTA